MTFGKLANFLSESGCDKRRKFYGFSGMDKHMDAAIKDLDFKMTFGETWNRYASGTMMNI